jgi:hypothetical protein
MMVRLTSSAVEVCDAGDISRAALCLVEETRCAVGRGSLLGLRVLAGRKSKCRSSEEGDGGRELHLESLMGVLGEAVRVLMRKLMICCDQTSSDPEPTFYIDELMATSSYTCRSGMVDMSIEHVNRVPTIKLGTCPFTINCARQ